ncbi:MAG: hypothetical protein ACRD0D_08345, partial [Acidimicrobiales bacterium]
SQENKARRTKTTREFVNPDGTHATQVFSQPVNVKDPATGEWIDIDPTIVDAGNGRLRTKTTPAGIELAASGDAASLVHLTIDANHAVSFGLAGGRKGSVRTEANEPQLLSKYEWEGVSADIGREGIR